MNVRDALRATGAFVEYPDAELDLLVSVCDLRRYASGDELCREGTVGRSCYCVVAGAIDVFKTMPQGEVPIASMGPGAIAGQVALTQKVRRTATIRARGEAVVLEFSRDTFERLLGASSPLALRFQRQIAVAGIRQLRDALKRIAAVFDTDDGKAPASARGSAAPPPDQAKAREVLALLEGAKGWDLSVETLDAVEVVSMPRHPSRRPSAY